MSQDNTQKKFRSGGRPKSDPATVRHLTIGVRVNTAEWNRLQIRAQLMGLTLAEWLRTAGLSRKLPAPPVPEANRSAYAELARLAVNLNQIARTVNEGQINGGPVAVSSHLLSSLRQEVVSLQKALLGLDTDLLHKEIYDCQMHQG